MSPGSSDAPSVDFVKRTAAEALATAFLLAIIVGSGVMAERLAPESRATMLLVNSLASGAGLTALILAFGPVSGAHMNPVITLTEAVRQALPWAFVPGYLAAQFAGALCGVGTAHLMFGLPAYTVSRHERAGAGQILGEFVATLGLIAVVRGASRLGLPAVASVVGLYIFAAYWFTSSTSFANPAVTIARTLTDTFSGIRPSDVSGFLVAQAAAGVTAVFSLNWMGTRAPGSAP